LEFLARKRRLDLSKKTDAITLINIDKNNSEVGSGSIDAGTRLLVVRKPEQPAKTDIIELTYNPRQTGV